MSAEPFVLQPGDTLILVPEHSLTEAEIVNVGDLLERFDIQAVVLDPKVFSVFAIQRGPAEEAQK